MEHMDYGQSYHPVPSPRPGGPAKPAGGPAKPAAKRLAPDRPAGTGPGARDEGALRTVGRHSCSSASQRRGGNLDRDIAAGEPRGRSIPDPPGSPAGTGHAERRCSRPPSPRSNRTTGSGDPPARRCGRARSRDPPPGSVRDDAATSPARDDRPYRSSSPQASTSTSTPGQEESNRGVVPGPCAPHHLSGDPFRLALVGLLRWGVRPTLGRRRGEGTRREGRRTRSSGRRREGQ